MARARMNALMGFVRIQRETGIETIPHVTPRDMTVMGLEGMLLGAHAEGVRNVLAVTGDPPHVGDYPGSRGVYEIDSIGLVQLIAGLNHGEDYVGKALDSPTSFFVGVAVNPSADDLDLELERFERKLAAGAHFAMTQALFDVSLLERFLERLGGTSPMPVLLGVWPLRSHAMALRLHNEVPGISVPDRVLDALRDAGADAPAAGLELARRLIAPRAGGRGIYVIPPFKRPRRARPALALDARGSRRPAGARECRADLLVRDAVGRSFAPSRPPKIVVSTRPCSSTTGPPELPLRTPPRIADDRREAPRTRRGRRRQRAADADGGDRVGTVLRVPEQGTAAPASGVRARERPAVEPGTETTATSLVGRTRRRAGNAGPPRWSTTAARRPRRRVRS